MRASAISFSAEVRPEEGHAECAMSTLEGALDARGIVHVTANDLGADPRESLGGV
jgi:hypothetical protein